MSEKYHLESSLKPAVNEKSTKGLQNNKMNLLLIYFCFRHIFSIVFLVFLCFLYLDWSYSCISYGLHIEKMNLIMKWHNLPLKLPYMATSMALKVDTLWSLFQPFFAYLGTQNSLIYPHRIYYYISLLVLLEIGKKIKRNYTLSPQSPIKKQLIVRI